MLAAILLGATLAVPGAASGNVSVAAAGKDVVVVWAARADSGSGTDVVAAFSSDGGTTFGEPVRVNDVAGEVRVNGEQPPHVAIAAGDVEVAWIARKDGVNVVRSARARAGSRRFEPAATVHADGLSGARGWHSLAVGNGGTVHVAWLDGRNAKAGGHGGMRQDLFQAFRGKDGKTVEASVAADVCFCCKTATAAGPDGALYVAWRHIYPPNLRDVAIARSSDGGKSFGAPVRVSQDDWKIDGCPDDGPTLAVDARGVIHVAWPTLVPGPTLGKGIFYSWSADGGRSFAPRVRLDEDDGAAAHPRLAVGDGRVVVVWDAKRRVRSRELALDAKGAAPRLGALAALGGDAPAVYPAVTWTANGPLVAWTETAAEGTRIRVEPVR